MYSIFIFTYIPKSFTNCLLCSKCLIVKDDSHAVSVQFSSVTVMSDSLRPHESQHARPPCPSPTPGVHSNSCPSSWWCHPAISSSVVPFSSCPQSLPASGSFQMSQFFASGGQSIGISALASALPMNIQDWFPLGLTGWIFYAWLLLNKVTHLKIQYILAIVYCSFLRTWDFPGGSDSKESACNAGDLGSIPGLERSSGGGHGNPLQYSCLENPHGQRSLVG